MLIIPLNPPPLFLDPTLGTIAGCEGIGFFKGDARPHILKVGEGSLKGDTKFGLQLKGGIIRISFVGKTGFMVNGTLPVEALRVGTPHT